MSVVLVFCIPSMFLCLNNYVKIFHVKEKLLQLLIVFVSENYVVNLASLGSNIFRILLKRWGSIQQPLPLMCDVVTTKLSVAVQHVNEITQKLKMFFFRIVTEIDWTTIIIYIVYYTRPTSASHTFCRSRRAMESYSKECVERCPTYCVISKTRCI